MTAFWHWSDGVLPYYLAVEEWMEERLCILDLCVLKENFHQKTANGVNYNSGSFYKNSKALFIFYIMQLFPPQLIRNANLEQFNHKSNSEHIGIFSFQKQWIL